MLPDLGERVFGAVGSRDLVPVLHQQLAEKLAIGGGVIDDEDVLDWHDGWPFNGSGGKRSRLDVLVDRLDQPFLSKRLGQVAIGSGEPAARAIEHAVLARQHDHGRGRSEEHTSELQSRFDLVCRLLLEKKNTHNRMYLRS